MRPDEVFVGSGFSQCLAHACVLRLMGRGRVTLTIVVHVDICFALRQKKVCDKFGRDVDEMVSVEDLGVLRWHSACFY